MRTPPSSNYNGLTLILDHASRFDTTRLLSGIAGKYVEEECITPLKLENCDIKTKDDKSPFLLGTKYIAELGIKRDIPEGYTRLIGNTRAIHTFFPQDACDFRNLESNEDDDENEDQISEAETKDSYPTRRSNYRFWLRIHLQKLLNPGVKYTPRIQVYPSEKTIIDFLAGTRNTDLYLDIETSRLHRAIQCIGLSSPQLFPTVYVVPVYLYNGQKAYINWHKIYRELFLAFLSNQLVIHNAAFDLFILRAWYKLPFPLKVYCTMCANHRCFPEAEKSLSHVISQWTEQEYHKDVNTEVHNSSQQTDMWYYNGKDVFDLHLIKQRQLAYARSIPGLTESITQANESIIPYLDTASLRGLPLNPAQAVSTEIRLSTQKTQLARVAATLTGIKNFNPNSTDQCGKFLFDTLNYVSNAKTAAGKKALGKKQLYQLMLKYNNPLIPVVIKYKQTAKDLSMLVAERWEMP